MADVNLLVAGAGGGIVAALRAQELGLSVAVIDANEHFLRANNTAMSTAMIPGAGSLFQQEAGVEDSPEIFADDVRHKTKGRANPVVTEALSRISAPLVEWLAGSLKLPLELVTDFEYPGHTRHRCHTVPGRHGTILLGMLHRVARERGIDIVVPARLVAARHQDDALVAVTEAPDGTTEEISCDVLVLATNGFGADAALVAEHIPEIAGAVYHGSEASRGDALSIGRAFGAAVDCLDAYQGHGALSLSSILVGWATVMHGGFIVNTSGDRFADETQGYSEFAALELTQPDHRAFIIFDQRIHDACLAFEDFRQTKESGVLRQADSVAGLAERLSLPADRLEVSFAQAAAGRRGATDPHGRSRWGETDLAAPFYGVEVRPALFHTQGGLAVDGSARVLNAAGEPIAGLYAAGGAAVGMSGRGADGYLAGNGLLAALGLSFIAAEDAGRRLAGR
ncbi:FAD-binding protein [Dactylosporangium sp. NPDC000521]|uniref:FAD-dependent oxidoreductase n=1 Tax=Dactylosporangium sp. NPDC000521 TaxID=3363975 RepID=UPI0036BFF0E6